MRPVVVVGSGKTSFGAFADRNLRALEDGARVTVRIEGDRVPIGEPVAVTRRSKGVSCFRKVL